MNHHSASGATVISPRSEAAAASGSSDEPPQRRAPRIEIHAGPGTELPDHLDMNWLRERFAKAAELVGQRAGRQVGSISIAILDDEQMAQLHDQHLGKAATTDVISFDLAESASHPIAAEIAVCADEAVRNARLFHHTQERELLLYALHGLLHCAGFDDVTDKGFQAMHRLEDDILSAIGVGATFSRDDGRARS